MKKIIIIAISLLSLHNHSAVKYLEGKKFLEIEIAKTKKDLEESKLYNFSKHGSRTIYEDSHAQLQKKKTELIFNLRKLEIEEAERIFGMLPLDSTHESLSALEKELTKIREKIKIISFSAKSLTQDLVFDFLKEEEWECLEKINTCKIELIGKELDKDSQAFLMNFSELLKKFKKTLNLIDETTNIANLCNLRDNINSSCSRLYKDYIFSSEEKSHYIILLKRFNFYTAEFLKIKSEFAMRQAYRKK